MEDREAVIAKLFDEAALQVFKAKQGVWLDTLMDTWIDIQIDEAGIRIEDNRAFRTVVYEREMLLCTVRDIVDFVAEHSPEKFNYNVALTATKLFFEWIVRHETFVSNSEESGRAAAFKLASMFLQKIQTPNPSKLFQPVITPRLQRFPVVDPFNWYEKAQERYQQSKASLEWSFAMILRTQKDRDSRLLIDMYGFCLKVVKDARGIAKANPKNWRDAILTAYSYFPEYLLSCLNPQDFDESDDPNNPAMYDPSHMALKWALESLKHPAKGFKRSRMFEELKKSRRQSGKTSKRRKAAKRNPKSPD